MDGPLACLATANISPRASGAQPTAIQVVGSLRLVTANWNVKQPSSRVGGLGRSNRRVSGCGDSWPAYLPLLIGTISANSPPGGRRGGLAAQQSHTLRLWQSSFVYVAPVGCLSRCAAG